MAEIGHEVLQGVSCRITATIKDAAEVVIPLSSIDACTLTLYDQATRAIINSRQAQDVLNANGTTIHATSGLLTCDLNAADNVFVGEKAKERHVALFKFTYSTTKTGIAQVFLDVVRVPWIA